MTTTNQSNQPLQLNQEVRTNNLFATLQNQTGVIEINTPRGERLRMDIRDGRCLAMYPTDNENAEWSIRKIANEVPERATAHAGSQR